TPPRISRCADGWWSTSWLLPGVGGCPDVRVPPPRLKSWSINLRLWSREGPGARAGGPALFSAPRNRHVFAVVFLKSRGLSSCVGKLPIVKIPIVAVYDSGRGRDTWSRSAFQHKPFSGGTIDEAGQLGGMDRCNE